MRYKELEIWKRSYQVVLQVYNLLKTCRDYGLKDQISRSAVSVPSNIAEGSERGSYKDNIRFLYIAKGSCAELATQISLAADLGYIPIEAGRKLESEILEIGRMIGGYIKFLSQHVKEESAEYF
ncbi:four helix bundle protein [Vibrio vulnificus]|uniref:four helix bundle protein n=1 Tax=Vibrio TaxID=662 RepID=UPI00030E6EDE|nr:MULTISPECIES: four helix bundle protein [Vibrio]MDF4701840.1 four helix bundle protein [Vibrio parahaemolyticus]EGQ7833819.1 four helix bundle protein [Vibrio vulnificus]EGQ8176339.1 four helix bundle protein [Vibrio vulnificus]EGQ9784682.1 four helix bundle protein [Vibrio vulnificus]EGR0057842.1 four helix bundle protein [Vibrio vulnificus]